MGEEKYLVRLLDKAIKKVYEEKPFLLKYSEDKRRGLEQAFVFRVGIYLNKIIKKSKYKNLDLDSEYNKKCGNIKVSGHFPNGFRPDLIIHKRDSNRENKLVVEFKGWWNSNIKKDVKKLMDLTSSNEDYRYLIGVFVRIKEDKPIYRYFINGVENLSE